MTQKMYPEFFDIKKKKIVKLSIPTIKGYTLVDHNDIIYLSALGNAAEIFLEGGKKIVSSKTLKEYEHELMEEPFVRIHDKTIVNLNKVASYVRADNGWVILENGKELKVSDGKKDDLLFFFRGIRK